MAIHAATASQPGGLRRSRFSWHFYTPGRRRWVMVQVVSGPCDQAPDDQATPSHALPLDEAPTQARLLDSFAEQMLRRRSF